MPTRCNRGFYCRSYCLLNMFRAPLCTSSGAQEYYTAVAACGISCCKNVKSNFVIFCVNCVLSLKCRVLSRFVTSCVECRGGRVWVFLVGFLLQFQCMQLSTTSTVIISRPTNGIPDPQTKLYTEKKTYQEHPHTAPTTFDTPSNKPR